MNDKFSEIIKECEREEENCLYSSTTLYFWLKSLRKIRTFFIVTPLLLGGYSGVKILASSQLDWIKYLMGIASLLAGILPSIFSALKLDLKIEQVDKAAAIYKILQGKFRRLRNIKSKDMSFENDFNSVIVELENIKSESITPPERFFIKAQNKIAKGDYCSNIDNIKNV